jgi:hypothetical protein
MKSNRVAFEYSVRLLKAGRSSTLTTKIFGAQPHPKGDWTSLIVTRMGRRKEEAFECAGIDGLQSHLLSFVYLRHYLGRLKREGYSFCDIDSDSETDPEWHFDALFKNKK